MGPDKEEITPFSIPPDAKFLTSKNVQRFGRTVIIGVGDCWPWEAERWDRWKVLQAGWALTLTEGFGLRLVVCHNIHCIHKLKRPLWFLSSCFQLSNPNQNPQSCRDQTLCNSPFLLPSNLTHKLKIVWRGTEMRTFLKNKKKDW